MGRPSRMPPIRVSRKQIAQEAQCLEEIIAVMNCWREIGFAVEKREKCADLEKIVQACGDKKKVAPRGSASSVNYLISRALAQKRVPR
mmetsp:Transcript_27423/g.44629  ORF Transcript_27423/g.44629 Transcript_27423/m.44629 type:complete len:88 (-) Transcript_27423:816-1079(-)|eukprot:CAMPEP_0184339798 /NCGR_PEP_ID=MMETSP1089-20130417/8491_1 /TAXON_ID=38269 ORGANISM="Gloeochaete wittrockiana, Strain SAG46.84" /NCGR_SAMPLE_ID=MMETSP1089 /ASSEMBLY_ACC=CAM_ASM_000445 /LENGTH=87 /DNA_ID=CAMNT_0026667263 /DNA_START=65 /DNA_END=328 /DNA_ORIENTATION=-